MVRIHKYKSLFFMLALAFFYLSLPGLIDANQENLTGPDFSNKTEQRNLMQEWWVSMPITHPPESGINDIVVSLDQHMYDLLAPLIKQYAEKKGIKIYIKKGTCGTSTGMLINKRTDIAGFCCPPAAEDRLPGLVFHTLGLDAISLVVHPQNPISGIGFDEAQKLFTGELGTWSTLKDPAARRFAHQVHVVTRLHCKQRPGHWRLLLDNEDLFSLRAYNVGSLSDMFNAVAADPYAIGHLAPWFYSQPDRAGKVKPLKINAVSPYAAEAVAEGRYPLYKVENLTTWTGKAANDKAAGLVQYLLDKTDQLGRERPSFTPVSLLRKNGWRFKGDELVGAPAK